MIGEYEIIEYKDQFHPERTYYKASIENGTTYHSDDFEKIVDWLVDYRVNKAKYEAQAKFEAGVIERFMNDVKYKD
jgi:hypothetical protein